MDRLTKAYFVLATAGILIAIYHAYGELTENFSACNINSQFSCGDVFASGYVSVFGIPFYLLGLIWFPLLLVLGLWFVRRRGQLNGDVLVPLLMVGNAFTVYLWYLELGVIRAICPVCVSMYLVNYILTGIALVAFLRSERSMADLSAARPSEQA